MRFSSLLGLAPFVASALAAPYNEKYAEYNLNTNQNAQSPLDYDTSFVPSRYHPSPENWRIPCYTILMDKFADGDPTNNDYFQSEFEWDWRETGFRFGGDLAGLESKLDYLAGMGIKAIFASGTPWINMLWQADGASARSCLVRVLTFLCCFFPIAFIVTRIMWSFLDAPAPVLHYIYLSIGYSPLDFTTLDPHWGHRDEWRTMIDAVHARGMYYVVDFTVATMGDLITWKG